MNRIHPTAIIDNNVVMGDNNFIGPCCIIRNAVIGSGNRFEAHCSVGLPPQHRAEKENGQVIIGDKNVFREFVTIHSPTGGGTKIGSDCYLMAYAHVSHDSVICDDVTMANGSQIGGHTHIMRGANIGLGAIIHQRQIVGAYAMIGMGCIVPKGKDILPGGVYVGNPAKLIKQNTIGLERARVDADRLQVYRREYLRLRGLS